MTATVRKPPDTLPGVITRSKWLPPMICIYGDAGIGKSTYGASAPKPIFVTTESGVENLDVARFPVAETLDAFLNNLRIVADMDHAYESVVIDTLNGLMNLYYQAKKDIPGEKNRKLYDFVGFGGHSGWSGVANDWKIDILPLLKRCQQRNMYVILLGHSGTYTDKTSTDDIVKTGASINKNVWKTILGDMDVVGKAEYIYSVKAHVGNSVKASTDEKIVDGVKVKQRRLVFEGGMEVDAKTRVGYELPPTMPLSWDEFAAHLGNVKELAAEVRGLWGFVPADKNEDTLKFLRVDSLEQLEHANRSALSMMRNRLLEAKAAAEADTATAGETTEPGNGEHEQEEVA